MFRLNLLQGFLYPLTAPKRLLAACLILPLSLAVLVPPALLGLGVFGTVSMNLKQGIGFSLLLLAVCVTIGFLPFTFLAGYTLRCRQQVMAGVPTLPAWDRWKQLLSDGGRMDTLALLFGLPTLLFFWGALGTVGLSLKNLHDGLTWSSAGLALLGSGTGLLLFCGAILWWFIAMLFSPIASLRLARGLSPSTSVAPRGMLGDIRRGWLDYLLCCVLTWGVSMIFSAAQTAFWPLVVISFPVQVYLQLVWANLLGQYARVYFPEQG